MTFPLKPADSGPLMIDIQGTRLDAQERARLSHPLVGGLILFARNYHSPAQLTALTTEVRALRHAAGHAPFLIAVDQEGGRVQRFRSGFTPLPPMRALGEQWDRAPEAAKAAARALGLTIASELRACGVDLSFTPVLDLDYGHSAVIGDRAFHRRPEAVIALAGALIAGLRQGGMGCCGKHFPGHGWANADSHVALPVDDRTLAELQEDLHPYRALPLDAIMPAHVVYPAVDAAHTACFSRKWHTYLRRDIGFRGVVFSDDLSMEAASVAGDTLARARAAHAAGCDMLLLCNSPQSARDLLTALEKTPLGRRAEDGRRKTEDGKATGAARRL
ncbi:MAG: beta-N-acetylhexosaminidase [Zoogloeaceae bacterium]|jgi:beta-N-acetylhexosaminidase|nr:beta-N-acetylhexosaminidase [Zoogloeaceae bacterium]